MMHPQRRFAGLKLAAPELVLSRSPTGHRQLHPGFYSVTLGHAPSSIKPDARSQRKGVGGRGVLFLFF